MKPTIALFAGDPAGIGPELVARLLADGSAAREANVLLVGSRESIDAGMRTAGCRFAYDVGVPDAGARDLERPLLVRSPVLDQAGFERGVVSAKSGRYMLDALTHALGLCGSGAAGAICFAPLNKAALRAGGMGHPDELHWFAETLRFGGTCVELNVLEGLWTSRVTSHVALSEVAALITREKVALMIQLMHGSLAAAGVASPRVAVCGLNPHNGDNGAYGREEIEVIGPGVELARSRGFPADGPFPADTAFVRATRKTGGYDGVVTMYHDQGQIAMKLLGFERGVTVQGGLPMPITTPAHGTAYDIAGQGVANAGAMRNAFSLACRMAERSSATAPA
ncbi:MAG TPA: 4-hydroxythreonine-4-phosphate dehydrogenase PdxA [Usitatibacter sp.]|nr:4-hydroxythreonine-4-phosphate dehydrogenase PdxA [Usitatibacter sp.]